MHKRATVILLLVCYLIPAIGVTVFAHYCNGKLSSVSFQLLGTEKCKCDRKKMKKDCCKTVNCKFKIQSEQQQTPKFTIYISKAFSVQPAILHSNNTDVFSAPVEKDFYNQHPPPLQLKQPLYLLNRVFRI